MGKAESRMQKAGLGRRVPADSFGAEVWLTITHPPHPPVFRKSMFLKGVKVICFDRLLQVYHSKKVAVGWFCHRCFRWEPTRIGGGRQAVMLKKGAGSLTEGAAAGAGEVDSERVGTFLAKPKRGRRVH